MDETAFAAHLAKCGAPLGPSEERMELHAGDLYLCCAAIAGGPDAVKKLRSLHRPVIERQVQRIHDSPAFIDEVEQRFWITALLPSPGETGKLMSYSGRGPLARWIGLAAQRIGARQ